MNDGGFGNDRGMGGGGMGMGGGGMGGMGGGYGGGRGNHVVHMRGLPFRVTENDIAEWFSSVVDPVEITIQYNNQGRPTGEADVYFDNEADAKKAMSKDRQNMQVRQYGNSLTNMLIVYKGKHRWRFRDKLLITSFL